MKKLNNNNSGLPIGGRNKEYSLLNIRFDRYYCNIRIAENKWRRQGNNSGISYFILLIYTMVDVHNHFVSFTSMFHHELQRFIQVFNLLLCF